MHEEKWQVWTSPAHLLVDTTDPADLVAARTAVQTVLTETDSAINTFDPTSELATINATGAGTYTLSPTLTRILTEAITAYERTSGAFDPRVPALGGPHGHSLNLTTSPDGHLVASHEEPVSLHEQVQLTGNHLTLAAGVQLDLTVGTPRLFAAGYRADAAAHLATFGKVPALNPHQLLEHIFESNLDGRGGASFSTYRKLTTTHQSTKTTIIANGAEGEYLSHKDRTLLLHAPHLVLDGLQIAGELIGTRNLALYAREESLATIAPLAAARGITCYTAPGTFISGEASAVANAITTGTPLPMNHTRRLAHPEKPQASSAKPPRHPRPQRRNPRPPRPHRPLRRQLLHLTPKPSNSQE